MGEETRKPHEATEPVAETGKLTDADLEQAAGGITAVRIIESAKPDANGLCSNESPYVTTKF